MVYSIIIQGKLSREPASPECSAAGLGGERTLPEKSEELGMPTTAHPTRRPRGSLTRDQVVDAALQLADEEGVEL